MTLANVVSFFTQATGDRIAQTISLVVLVVLLILALSKRKQGPNPDRARHLWVGAGILVLLQVCALGVSLLSPHLISETAAGSLTRAAALLTVVWAYWVAFENHQKPLRTGFCVILSVVLGFTAVFTLTILNLQPQIQNNAAIQLDLFWQIVGLALALAAALLILLQKPTSWQSTWPAFLLLGLGHALQITQIDYSFPPLGWVHWTTVLALPFFFTLLQHRTTPAQPKPVSAPARAPVEPDQKLDTRPQLVEELLEINLKEDPSDRLKATLKAITLSLVADICYLVRLSPTGEKVELIAGYDLIREIFLPAATLKRDDLLHIMDAWADRRTLHLSQVHANTQDVNTLTLLLKYHRIGNLLAYPLYFQDHPAIGGIIILSPYTGKQWGTTTKRLLDEIRETLTQVLFGDNPLEQMHAELDTQYETITLLRQTSEHLNRALTEKENLLADLKNELLQLKANYQIEKRDNVQQMNALRQEITSLEAQSASRPDIQHQLEQLNVQIRQLTIERDQLHKALDRANARIQHLETQAGQTGPTRLSVDNEVISLDSIAANARLQVASRLQAKGLLLEIRNPDGHQLIKTDPELLQTIYQGLLENAIAAAPSGSTVHFQQNLSLETGMLLTEITDHGQGLSQEEQALLFGAAGADLPGIGNLGAIRNAIRAIRALNGKVWLRSQKGKFTTFRIQLPVRIID